MGVAKKPSQAKLFLAVMYTDETVMQSAIDACVKKFGAVDFEFGPLEVSDYTDYYNKEMGAGILKRYMTFKKLIRREEISNIKRCTNDIEKGLIINEKRTVNLDPGYMTNDKLILATTKDFYHRIYLDSGIYAEVTLHYRKGKYRFFSWTYPDYKEKELQRFLMKARGMLVKEIRGVKK